MDVSVTGPKRRRQACVQAVVVEDSNERLIEGENTDSQCRGRRDETCLYFAGKRQALTLRGTSRLYRRIWNSAANPSRHVIFFPSAYVRPL